MGFNVQRVRRDFPITRRKIQTPRGKTPLIFMDHGASTHAPYPVMDTVQEFLSNSYANVHRGNHTLSQEASHAFEEAGRTIAHFVGGNEEGLLWCSNTTQALDLAAHLVAHEKGVTITTASEHHSNDLPHRKRGKVLHAEVDACGRLLLDDLEDKLQKNKVKLLALTGASNVTGLMFPLPKLARLAHDAGARFLVDAAQLYAHAPIDMKPEGHPEHIDFLAAAGHKSYAPYGSSVLIAPTDLIDEAPPHTPGGGTVTWVTSESNGFRSGPDRQIGGTPNITGAIAFAAATQYLDNIGMDNVREHEVELIELGLKRFQELQASRGVELLGPLSPAAARHKVGVFAFLVPGHPHAGVSQLLDRHYGIATRNGCFCAQPLFHRLLQLGDVTPWIKAMESGGAIELPGATRAAFGLYNTRAEVETLFTAIDAIASGKHDVGKVAPMGAAESS